MAPKYADQIVSTHSIVKSESDTSEYRGLVLKNGLKVLLVSDPTTDKSAAALSVQIGYMSDPWKVPGLAHFCEHMLFLGTKKYPRENQYNEYLSEHAGTSNAYTGLDHTCYFFDVAPENFKEASDIFAQFFIEPLFDQDCTDREVNAVNSENEKNIKQDAWRLWRLEGATANPKHDFAKFGTGNRVTLQELPAKEGIDLREALLEFHGKWYSANMMSLCLLGKESLDDLSDLAVEMFAAVKNKNVDPPTWPEHPFTDKELRLQAKVVPVKDSRSLVLTFPVPDLREQYHTNPGHYVSHLVGHEGEGSLLSYLKRRGWANSVSCGFRPGARGFGFFVISLTLSPEGLDRTDDITHAIFQYLALLRKEGPQSWVFDELKNLGTMQFRFKPKERPIMYVPALAENMHAYEWPDILSAPYIVDEYKPELIEQLMSHLTPDKLRVAIVSKTFEGKTDQKEHYYSTEYSTEEIPSSKIEAWSKAVPDPELKFPPPNEFIPTNFDLAPENPAYTDKPGMLIDDPHHRLWFMQDKEYKLPTNMAVFQLRSPLAYQDPLSRSLTHMATVCFNDANNEYFYPAVVAGSSYNLENTLYGLLLTIRGFSQRQQAILERVCERLVDFKIDPTRFNILKEVYVRGLKNFAAEQPYEHANFYTTLALTEKYWTHDEVLAVIDQCTVERCEEFFRQILSKLYVEAIVHGSVTADQARKMGETIQQKIKCQPLTYEQTRNFREHKLRDGELYQMDKHNEVHPTNCVMTYFQVGPLTRAAGVDVKPAALNDLFCQIIDEPCFAVLRTKEQLGYMVWGGSRRMLDAYGVRVLIQSDKHPSFVSSRIETFLNDYMKNHLENMTQDEFEQHKKSLIAQKLEKPKKLDDKTKRLSYEITSRSYIFNREKLEADAIANFTKADVLEFFSKYIAREGPERRQLLVNVESKLKPGETGSGVRPTQIISDVSKFKSEHGFFRDAPKAKY